MKKFIVIVFSALIFVSCSNSQQNKVEIIKSDTGYQLLRNGEPYFIKGAGAKGHYEILSEYGGNSIRTWGVSDWDEAFRNAEKYNLTVCAGLWLEQERQGFDYNDDQAVEKQFARFKEAILKYKDHPQLLMWCIGNELDLFYTNPKVWDAVEEVAKFIHEVDGNHPTMTVTSFIEKDEVAYIKEKCPSIDILGVNVYAALPVLSKFLDDFGWEGPYVVGEWGTFGHWEVPKTSWDEPIEYNSSQKADIYRKGYAEYINDAQNCLGSYVFFWGNKQERTATWYSMFLPGGEKTEVVDVMSYSWQGAWPENRAPHIANFSLADKKAADNIKFKAGTTQSATVDVSDPDDDSLKIVWEILHETTDKRSGGDIEQKPDEVKNLILKQDDGTVSFKAPDREGPYRIFVYVYDQKGGAAHANIPFYVDK